MPRLIEDPTPTEELPLPLTDATVRVPDGEAGLRAALLRLEALERAIRLHERATSHPAIPRRPGDRQLYRRLRESDSDPGSNGAA
jgi:hypothetical protein